MSFLIRTAMATMCCFLGAIGPGVAADALAADGLVPVRAKQIDEIFLLPRADFRPYSRVLLRRADVALGKNWLRDVNRRGATLSGRVTTEEANDIVASAREGFDAAWVEAFRSAGYEIVTEPGNGVLLVSPSLVNLQVNAPTAWTTGIERNYTTRAGEAMLEMEVRDSLTGKLLGRLRDRRQTMKSPTLRRTDAASNDREFGRLFAAWASITTRLLGNLKARSPLPEILQPGQLLVPR